MSSTKAPNKTKKTNAARRDITVVFTENNKSKDKTKNYTNEELNEKMYYFYNNGGPVMDI